MGRAGVDKLFFQTKNYLFQYIKILIIFVGNLNFNLRLELIKQSGKFKLEVAKGLLRCSRIFLTTNMQIYFFIMKIMFISETYTNRSKQKSFF